MVDRIRSVLIAGAGAIGSACARRLARDGARVVLLDKDGARLQASSEPFGGLDSPGVRLAASVELDLRDPEAGAKIAATIDPLDGLDLLIFAAGSGWFGDCLGEDPAVLADLLEGSVVGLKRALVACAPALAAKKGLAVVISGTDSRAPDRFAELWGVTSACMQATLKCFAADVAAQGVRTLSCTIHGVSGGGFDEISGELASVLGIEEEDALRLFAARNLVPAPDADQVAAAIVSLADAPLFGATLALDGGATAKYWP